MRDDEWFWGVVVRVDDADDLLRRLAELRRADGVSPQRPGTGHVTLLYAPVRGDDGMRVLADAARPIAAAARPFRLRLGGFGEFVTPGRVVAWLGVEDGTEELRSLRLALCNCDEDMLAHPFVPHCTLAYGDSPATYESVREAIRTEVDDERVDVEVRELWIAGFRRGGHPADDLVYSEPLPLGTNGDGAGT